MQWRAVYSERGKYGSGRGLRKPTAEMRQGGAFLLYFIAQIMTSKSPARSCEDCDETALSYSEIKALCAGNPLIAEKMNLDNEVAKLRMLKSEHQNQHYRLEDSILKYYPQQIAAVQARIAGIARDMERYAMQKEKCMEVLALDASASVEKKFPGMIVNGTIHSEKEPAAKALLGMCKMVAGRDDDIIAGEYMGFDMSLRYDSYSQQIHLLLHGAMTYQVDLGTDALGNITRINNALDNLSQRMDGVKEQLADAERQKEAARLELETPFAQDAELAEKESRLALLNAELNIDGDGGIDVLNDTDDWDVNAEITADAEINGQSNDAESYDDDFEDEFENESEDNASASRYAGTF